MGGSQSEMDYEKVKSGLEDNSIVLINVGTVEERRHTCFRIQDGRIT